jgi:hypothetical protein
MAKKNTDGSAAPRRRAPAAGRRPTTSDPAAAPIDVASVGPIEPIDTAADRSSSGGNGAPRPTYEQIAEEAYRRYLSRGGSHGQDFDDWIEAERALTRRHTG